jgi:sugar lactone lactonase YvrE
MKKLNILFGLSILNIATSTYANQNSQTIVNYKTSIDWVTDGVFTKGIEGPAVAVDGSLYVVNYQEQGTIGRVTAKNTVERFLTLANGSIGNGIRFDSDGNMYIADYVNHNILLINKAVVEGKADTKIHVYANSPLMNQPNDIAMMANGIILASDPNWSASTGNLWRINTQQEITLLEKNMGTTNGIAVSYDNKTLYVNESVQRNVWQYTLNSSGVVTNKQLLIKFSEHGLDGMRAHKNGKLYIARYGKGVVAVVSDKGELLEEIVLKGKYPTNLAFGGVNGKQVFVTMQQRGAIETFFIE